MHDWVDDDTNMDATAERGTPLLQVLGAENHLIRGLLVNLQGRAAFGDMHLTFVRAKGTVLSPYWKCRTQVRHFEKSACSLRDLCFRLQISTLQLWFSHALS